MALSGSRGVYANFPNELEQVPSLSLNGEWIVYIADSEELVVESAHLGIDSPFSNPVKMEIPGHFHLQAEKNQTPPATLFNEYYRREFRLPASWRNQRILLRFEGVLSPYEVWIDGKRVGRCDFPTGRADFDITDVLSSEKYHAAAVKVLTSETPDLRPLTGIFRDVTLLALPNCSIEKILAVPEIPVDAGAAKLNIEVALSRIPQATQENDLSLSLELFTPYGESVAQTTITWFKGKEGILTGRAILPAGNLKMWTAETPVLHRLNAELRVGDQPAHRTSMLVGLRRIETRLGVLTVNGTPVHLRGILYRESHPQAGWALREDHWIADLRRMKEANINAIRLVDRLPHPRFLDLCDEMGFYVIPDLILPQDDDLRDKALRSILERDFNHPCILAWSLGDASSWDGILEESAERI
ncbi:MAG: glycoside hydrolase family 2 protein, partial [Candidatus Hinthialibacter sp.]